jgi:hypothetical protein
MRKIMFLILFLLCIPAIYAPSKSNVELFTNQNVTVGGRVIKFVSLTQNKILLEIDGSRKISDFADEFRIDWINFAVVDYNLDDLAEFTYVKLNISMDYDCGDKDCEAVEKQMGYCCRDCGCRDNSTEACVGNRCILIECREDANCTDNNTCTTDKCSNYQCVYEEIILCEGNDGCCPVNCNSSNDNDCTETILNSLNASVTEALNKTQPNASEDSSRGCEEGEIANNTYCRDSRWNAQKNPGDLCVEDYECITGFCRGNECSNEDKDPFASSAEKKTIFQKLVELIKGLFS